MIPFEGAGTPLLKLSELSKSWRHYLSNEKVQQVQIQVDLQIADRLIQLGNSTTYYADLRQSFLESYKKDEYFQISVLGLDTATWRLRGRSRFKHEVHLRNARLRIRELLIKWHGRLGLPPTANQEFSRYLEKELHVTPDAEPFSGEPHCGESHWWIPESPPDRPQAAVGAPVLGESAAAAAGRPQDAQRVSLGTPAWAFNPHPRRAAPTAAALRSALPPEFRRPRRGRGGRTTALRPRTPASPRRRCPTPPWLVGFRACAARLAPVEERS